LAKDPKVETSLEFRVHPGSNKREIVSIDGGYNAYLTARPIDGQANADLLELVSDCLKSPKSKIEIVKGHHSQTKRLVFRELFALELSEKFATLNARPGDN